MSEAYNILRAKSIKDEQIKDTNLLLKDHVLQTLGRLVALYSYTEKNKEHLSNQWLKNDEKKDVLFTSLAKALFIHDLGKIEEWFQRQLFNQKKDDEDKWEQLRLLFNWDKYPKQSIKRHEYTSLFWSCYLLDDEKDLLKFNGKIRTAVLFHHYNQFYTDAEKEILEVIRENREFSIDYLIFLSKYKDLLKRFLELLIKEVEEKYGQNLFLKKAVRELQVRIGMDEISELKEKIEKQSPDISVEMYDPEIGSEEEQQLFLLMSGILKRCDHCASAEIKIESTENLGSFFQDIERNSEKAIEEKGAQKDSFWQKPLLTETNEDYPLLIAPTGSGKTEFALLWAAKQKRKLVYTLPLRVALNDLFDRFKKYALGEKENSQHNDEENVISLLHSTAFIEYVEEEQRGKGISIDQKISSSRNFASPLVLTTPDQVFLTALNFYGSDKLKSIYPLSAIVIDEIQAYDPEMAAIIIKSIADIQSLGGNILIMTATYPPYFQEFFAPSRNENKILPKSFSSIKIDNYNKIKNYTVKRHKLELIDAPFGEKKERKPRDEDEAKSNMDFEESAEFKNRIKEQIGDPDKKNIAIICNTVSKAIDIHKFIEDSYKEEKRIYLLHSRLIECVKQRKVKEIKKEIEKKQKGEDFERVILIATQIVEASVDVDFDVLITEASPIDSQIQRWGRVFRNRYDKDKNPLDYDKNEPNIIIFTKTDSITKRIYDGETIEKTVEYLTEHKTNLSKTLNYEDEKKLVEQTFEKKLEHNGITKTLKKRYEDTIRDLFNKLKYFSIEKRSEAQRVFRKIAGLAFVFPDLMETDEWVKDESRKNEEIELRKIFAEIVRNHEYKEFTWKDIIQKIKVKRSFNEEDKKLQWNLRKLLNDYSINIPIYYIEGQQEERGVYLLRHEFKGFYVWKLKKEKIGEVLKKGIDVSEPKIDDYLLEENVI